MIGRAGEAAAIDRFAEQVPSGPVGLLIEGEPGIGKTTVMLEAIRAARERRYRVLPVRPAEAEADLSFAALGDLVGGVFDEVSDALPPPQRQALEVALLLRDADAPADPRTTASALLTMVTFLSSRDPLVIAIDDAQWMDRASRHALEFSGPAAATAGGSRRRASHWSRLSEHTRPRACPRAGKPRTPRARAALAGRPAPPHSIPVSSQALTTNARPRRGGVSRQSVLCARDFGRPCASLRGAGAR